MHPTAPKPVMTLANRITIVRIMGVPVFVLMVVYYRMSLAAGAGGEYYRWAALLVFAAVALTDALDGYFARSRNEITELGRILDPLADKLLLVSGLILLTPIASPQLKLHIPVWFTLLVISRDVILVLGAALIHHFAGTVVVRPRVVGKIATFLQMLTIVWVLMEGAAALFTGLVWAAGAFTLASFILYVLDGARQLGNHPAAQPHP